MHSAPHRYDIKNIISIEIIFFEGKVGMNGKLKALIAIIIVVFILIVAVIGLLLRDDHQEGRIEIDGDDQLLDEVDRYDWPGDGTPEKPFIIRSVRINVSGIMPCISIANTSKHLVIQDCVLAHNLDEEDQIVGVGIRLFNARNITVIGNDVVSVLNGLEVISCSELTIINNSMDGNYHCSDTDRSRFINNQFAGVGANVLIRSNSNVFQNNVIQTTRGTGLLVQDSDINEFSNNTFEGKPLGAGGTQGWTGLVLSGSSNNTLYMDQMQGGGYLSTGMGLLDSHSNVIFKCKLIGRTGIYMADSSENSIVENEFHDAVSTSMEMIDSDRNTVAGNNMSGDYSNVGIDMNSCDRNVIRENRMSGSSSTAYIMNLVDSTENAIVNNTILYIGSGVRTHSLAFDNMGQNSWNDSANGNYWSDWTVPDADADGVVDYPYVLDGSEGAMDSYPRIGPIL